MAKATFGRTIEALISERIYQILRWGQKDTGNNGITEAPHGVGAFITIIDHYLTEAKAAWATGKGDDAALDLLRKIGALVIGCFEQHGVVYRDLNKAVQNKHTGTIFGVDDIGINQLEMLSVAGMLVKHEANIKDANCKASAGPAEQPPPVKMTGQYKHWACTENTKADVGKDYLADKHPCKRARCGPAVHKAVAAQAERAAAGKEMDVSGEDPVKGVPFQPDPPITPADYSSLTSWYTTNANSPVLLRAVLPRIARDAFRTVKSVGPRILTQEEYRKALAAGKLRNTLPSSTRPLCVDLYAAPANEPLGTFPATMPREGTVRVKPRDNPVNQIIWVTQGAAKHLANRVLNPKDPELQEMIKTVVAFDPITGYELIVTEPIVEVQELDGVLELRLTTHVGYLVK